MEESIQVTVLDSEDLQLGNIPSVWDDGIKPLQHVVNENIDDFGIPNFFINNIIKKSDDSINIPETPNRPADFVEIFAADQSFKCLQCSFRCDSANKLKTHYHIHQPKKPFHCFDCGYQGTSREDFKKHCIHHIKKEAFECSQCNFTSMWQQVLDEHVATIHKNINLNELQNIDLIPVNMRLKMNTNKFKDLKHEKKVLFVCSNCYFIFKTQSEMDKHAKKYHSGNTVFFKKTLRNISGMNSNEKCDQALVCSECHFVFTTEKELLKHHLKHKNITKCFFCNLQCVCHAKLKEHFAIHHSQFKKFACYACDQTFKLERYVRIHMKKKHKLEMADRETFKCPICSFITIAKEKLEAHLQSHDKTVDSQAQLQSHDKSVNSSEHTLFHAKEDTDGVTVPHKGQFPAKSEIIYRCIKCDDAEFQVKYLLTAHTLECAGQIY